MSSLDFSLTFDGEALLNHEIEPSHLADALLSIESIFKEANSVLNRSRKTTAKIKIKGSFESGSFIIHWVLSVDWMTELFTCTGVAAICNAKAIYDIVFKSLPRIFKFLKGQRPDKIMENEDGSFTIFKSGESIKIEKRELDLIKVYKIRKSFEKLVSPLNSKGIDALYVREKGAKDPELICDKEQISYFKCPASEKQKIDEPAVFITRINIIDLSFKEGNEWYVNDGDSGFSVIIEDNDFIEKVSNSSISFAKGDILKVQIRKEQYIEKDSKKIKSNYFIEKVLSHDQNITIF